MMFIKEHTGSIKDSYKISSSIGRGAFGEVRKCLHRETKALRAVKIVNKKNLAESDKLKLVSEINILKSLDHPNILKLYEFFQDHKRYFLVTELCQGGELFDKIAQEQYFDELDASRIIKQILSAINYCHQRNIVHRDLKPENILMNNDQKNPSVTIIDFGTSSTINEQAKLNKKYGTPYYIAPEVLKNNYDEKCDMWSIGVILFILLVGYPPFNGKTEDKIIQKVKQGGYNMEDEDWNDISDSAKNLVKRMLTLDPKKRISAKDALQHPWITELNQNELDEKLTRNTLINLRNFQGNSKIKQAVLAFIATHLTSENEKKDLGKIFKAIDTDGDGNLTKEEVLQGFEEHFGIPISEEQVDEMFKTIDLDGNGTIDYTEFVMATVNEAKIMTTDRLEMAFKQFDADGNGSLSPDEIKDYLYFKETIHSEEIDKIIEDADENGDGEIQFPEFCAMMKNLNAKVSII